MTQITKDMTIGEVLSMDAEAGKVFFMNGMHCFGCPHSAGESIEEASMAHGIPCEPLVDALNKFFEEKEQ